MKILTRAPLSLAIAALTGAGFLGAAILESRAAAQKIVAIEHGHPPAGSRIFFPASELNAFLRDEASARVPGGVRNLNFTLQSGRATGSALVDFVKMRQGATGQQPGWLARNLFSGERPVLVTARLTSEKGRARVDLERVEVSGVPISGRALDFLIDDYFKPAFPQAKVAEWFAMGFRMDHLALSPAGMTVVLGR